MKIAVSGATGHVGMNLIPLLKDAAYEMSLLSHENSLLSDQPGVEIYHGDVLEPDSLSYFVSGASVVIHLAAVVTIKKRAPGILNVNINGTRNMLEAARKAGAKKFIHVSSIHSMNVHPLNQPLDESRALNLKSPTDYDRSKAISEKMVMESASEEFSTVILNPTAILGPNDYKPSLLGRALIKFYQGKIPVLLNGGYNWVDVRDVAMAINSAINNAPSGSKFLLGGHWKSLHDLCNVIHELGGTPCPRLMVPFTLAKRWAGFMEMLPGNFTENALFTSTSLEYLQYSHRHIMTGKAEKMLGYRTRPFEESVEDTIAWFRSHKMIN